MSVKGKTLRHRITVRSEKPHLGLSPAARTLIRHCIRTFLEQENTVNLCEVNVLVTDEDGIRALNRDFRQTDKPTDVLSFPAQDRIPGHSLPCEEEAWSDGFLLLGDIALSLPTVRAQALACGHPETRELGFLTVHGALHLLGYDHTDPVSEAGMNRKTEAVLAALGLPRCVVELGS